MAEVNINLKCDLQHAVKVQYLDGNLFSQDAAANTINIEVTDNGAPATIGGTVSANVIRPDGGTVAVTGGTISGNIVSITLPAACYALVGMITVIVKLSYNSTETTIAALTAYVYQSSTDTVVDPGTVVSSIQDLIDAIDEAVDSIPADYSSLWTSLAPAFSSSTAYTAGQYVTYNSGLYRFTKAHAAGSWASGDVVAVNIGGELSDVKSAINELDYDVKNCSVIGSETPNLFDGVFGTVGGINSDGSDNSSTSFKRSDYFYIPKGIGRKIYFKQENSAWMALYVYMDDGTAQGVASGREIPDNAVAFRCVEQVASTGNVYVGLSAFNNSYEYTKKTFIKQENLIIPTEMLQTFGSKIVNMGDSIFGNSDGVSGEAKSVSSFIADFGYATVYNAAFGGTSASLRNIANWDAMSFASLADAIATNDFSEQESAISTAQDFPINFASHLATLKNIDWTNIDFLTVSFGSNDFNSNVAIGECDGNKETFLGAMSYGLKKLMSKFPQLKAVVLTPTWRWYIENNNYSQSSDTYTNAIGLTVVDYVEACDDLAKNLHVLKCDDYDSVGINESNYAAYFPADDGAHHNIAGRERIARRIVGFLNANSNSSDRTNLTAIENAIGNIEEEVGDIVEKTVVSTNKFNSVFGLVGGINEDGTPNTNINFEHSDYYKFASGIGRTLYSKSENNAWFGVYTYASDKSPIASVANGYPIDDRAVYFVVYKQVASTGNFYIGTVPFNNDYTYLETNTIKNTAFSKDNADYIFEKKIGTRNGMATWIDDDGVCSGYGGQNITTIVIPTAESVGIPVTFALITPLTDTVTIDGVSMTRAEYFQKLQRKGHQMAAHPIHAHWYGPGYDISKVEPELIDCITELQSYNFLYSHEFVYPGSSNSNPAIVNIVRKWCPVGVIAGYGTPNHLGITGAWQIKRTFINFEDYYSNHSSDTGFVSAMQWYKDQVDSAVENGDWIIFGTHSYQFTDSNDTSNPNANTRGNVELLMQYAVDQGLEFRTLHDAFSRRKQLYDFDIVD